MKHFESQTSRQIYSGKVVSLEEVTYKKSDGSSFVRGVVRHPGAVVAVPQLPNGKLLLVRQFRAPLDKDLLEFPAGTLEPGEAPDQCIARELVEEISFEAGTIRPLGLITTAPGFCDEVLHCYFANELTPREGKQDEDEGITVEAYTAKEVAAKIVSGEIIDAKSICTFYKSLAAGYLHI